jgi:hypothetical protein
VVKGTFVALVDGGKAASSGLISISPALAAWLLKASASKHPPKTMDLMTKPLPRKADPLVGTIIRP